LRGHDQRSLKEHAESVGLDWLSTPDDHESLARLVALDVKAIKIASAEVDNLPFLAHVATSKRPVLLSTGMSELWEVARAVEHLLAHGAPEVMLLHCTSNYPCLPEHANLKAIETLRRRFRCVVGYSDHTHGSEAGVAAVALGARLLEKHLTLDTGLPGPDHRTSATPSELAAYVRAVRTTATMLGDGRKRPQPTELEMRAVMRRSIVAARPLRAGERLSEADLAFKRAGRGISPSAAGALLGRHLRTDKHPDATIEWDDLAGD
jgi:N,N'-diacetyllegionaminate synthase